MCRRLIEAGDHVVALVRPGSDYEPLIALDVEPFEGDIQSLNDLLQAAESCSSIINSAALLGGAVQDADDHARTNTAGAFHAYDAGARHAVRVVTLSSTPFPDHRATLTEEATVAESWHDDAYTRSKGAAHVEAKRRAVEEGADINIVIPGATFGPGVCVGRALGATSFNRTIRGAVNGKVARYLTYPAPWVLADDVAAACVAAATRGRAGRTYLAFGAEDAQSTASWLNLACEIAGVPHRVAELSVRPDDRTAVARFGETQMGLAARQFPVPWFDNAVTRQELDYRPRSLRQGMEETIAWLRGHGQIG